MKKKLLIEIIENQDREIRTLKRNQDLILKHLEVEVVFEKKIKEHIRTLPEILMKENWGEDKIVKEFFLRSTKPEPSPEAQPEVSKNKK